MLELVGTKLEVNAAADTLGYADRPTNQTDMIFVGLGIFSEVSWGPWRSISEVFPSA